MTLSLMYQNYSTTLFLRSFLLSLTTPLIAFFTNDTQISLHINSQNILDNHRDSNGVALNHRKNTQFFIHFARTNSPAPLPMLFVCLSQIKRSRYGCLCCYCSMERKNPYRTPLRSYAMSICFRMLLVWVSCMCVLWARESPISARVSVRCAVCVSECMLYQMNRMFITMSQVRFMPRILCVCVCAFRFHFIQPIRSVNLFHSKSAVWP